MLQRLLALDAVDLASAFERAAQGVAEVLGADKVDVFVREADSDYLVALGTSNTPMGRREREAGLDRIPLERGGLLAQAYRLRQSYVCPRTEANPDELAELLELLGVRSTMGAPLTIGRDAIGIVLASSATPNLFGPKDLRFLESVARWIGLVAQRAALVEQLTSRAAEEGFRSGASSALEVLTPRQREVAGLVAQGLTNAEIADLLVRAEGTVANHVQDIMRRLGLRRRTQLAVWIAERDRS